MNARLVRWRINSRCSLFNAPEAVSLRNGLYSLQSRLRLISARRAGLQPQHSVLSIQSSHGHEPQKPSTKARSNGPTLSSPSTSFEQAPQSPEAAGCHHPPRPTKRLPIMSPAALGLSRMPGETICGWVTRGGCPPRVPIDPRRSYRPRGLLWPCLPGRSMISPWARSAATLNPRDWA